MDTYEELSLQKKNGKIFHINDLTIEELKRLYFDENIPDSMIAELYGVKKSKITYMRKKHGLTSRGASLEAVLFSKTDDSREFNMVEKRKMLTRDNIGRISKAITHFAFRNGPVEDMHAHPRNQLSEEDMKTLNKFMVNRLAYVFTLIVEERWIEFGFLIRCYDMFGNSWDEPVPDDGGTKETIERILKI